MIIDYYINFVSCTFIYDYQHCQELNKAFICKVSGSGSRIWPIQIFRPMKGSGSYVLIVTIAAKGTHMVYLGRLMKL